MENLIYNSPKLFNRGGHLRRDFRTFSQIVDRSVRRNKTLTELFLLNPFGLHACRVEVSPRGLTDAMTGIRLDDMQKLSMICRFRLIAIKPVFWFA